MVPLLEPTKPPTLRALLLLYVAVTEPVAYVLSTLPLLAPTNPPTLRALLLLLL